MIEKSGRHISRLPLYFLLMKLAKCKFHRHISNFAKPFEEEIIKSIVIALSDTQRPDNEIKANRSTDGIATLSFDAALKQIFRFTRLDTFVTH